MQGASMTPARLILKSGVGKLGPMAVTYASVQSSCPRSCKFFKGNVDKKTKKTKQSPCYAQGGRVWVNVVRHLDAVGATALETARAEAREIKYWGARAEVGTHLRLHVSGECRSNRAARIVSGACEKFWPGKVNSYCHAWRTVARKSWGKVSVLASMEDPRDGLKAIRKGYAPALVVREHPKDGKAWTAHGITWIPCPEQTRGRTCSQCRLCFDDAALKKRRHGITFAPHGTRAGEIKRRLPVIQ